MIYISYIIHNSLKDITDLNDFEMSLNFPKLTFISKYENYH